MSTRVGYAGGTKENPIYYSLDGHSETIQIIYDPKILSYSELLDIFWQSHNPIGKPYSRQYMSIIFYHDDNQKKQAEESRNKREAELQRSVYTTIVPAGAFYSAEDYHQKYYLQSFSWFMDELRSLYPDFDELIDSTIAARLNGAAGGYGTVDLIREELDSLDLPPETVEKILGSIDKDITPLCPVPF